MPTTFAVPLPADGVDELLAHVMRRWHDRLHEAKVRVGVLWAANEDGPALKHGGYKVLAKVKVAPLELRVVSRMYADPALVADERGLDALLKIDEDAYRDLPAESQVALLDHELSHLDLVEQKVDGRMVLQRDDIGRPKLKLVDGDWNGGDGFASVVMRHGEAAVELINARFVHSAAQAAARIGEKVPR